MFQNPNVSIIHSCLQCLAENVLYGNTHVQKYMTVPSLDRFKFQSEIDKWTDYKYNVVTDIIQVPVRYEGMKAQYREFFLGSLRMFYKRKGRSWKLNENSLNRKLRKESLLGWSYSYGVSDRLCFVLSTWSIITYIILFILLLLLPLFCRWWNWDRGRLSDFSTSHS